VSFEGSGVENITNPFCIGHTFLTNTQCYHGFDVSESSSDYDKLGVTATVEINRDVIEGDSFCGTGFLLKIDDHVVIDTARLRRPDGYFRDDEHGTSSFASHVKFHDHNLVLKPGNHISELTTTSDGCHENTPDVDWFKVTFSIN